MQEFSGFRLSGRILRWKRDNQASRI